MQPATPVTEVEPYRGFVVLAQDNPFLRHLMVATLNRAHFVVLTVTDSGELLRYFNWANGYNNRVPLPDLVVADVRTGNLDILRDLQAIDCFVPTILVATRGDHGLDARARALHPVAVLDDPLDLDGLRDAALRAVDRN